MRVLSVVKIKLRFKKCPFKRDEYEDFGKCDNYSSPSRSCSCSCLLNCTIFVYNLCLYSRLSIVHGKRAFGTTADQFYSANFGFTEEEKLLVPFSAHYSSHVCYK